MTSVRLEWGQIGGTDEYCELPKLKRDTCRAYCGAYSVYSSVINLGETRRICKLHQLDDYFVMYATWGTQRSGQR